jgi:glycosyltransferase involved in cell wall biosynthesis
MNKFRYLLFAGDVPEQPDPESLVQSGLYCWQHAFNRGGSVGICKASLDPEFLQSFDIIHVNYVPGNIPAITAIHNAIKNSSTKLIMNIDYAVGVQASIDPYLLAEKSQYVDFLFHVEPQGANLMSYYLKRPVYVNPHPCCVELLSSQYRSAQDVAPVVLCQYHRYQYTWSIYFYAALKARAEKFAKFVLANYAPGQISMSIEWFFDDVIRYRSYADYIPFLAKSLLNMDIPPDFVGGRGVVDAAALGIPTIGSKTSYAQSILFPGLAVDPWDYKAASDLLDTFKEYPDFYGQMVRIGTERSKYFGLNNSRERLVRLLESEGVL